MSIENKKRACNVCGDNISHRRSDAITCSDNCRARKSRELRAKSVLVKIRVPSPTYTSLIIATIRSKSKGVNEHVRSLVMEQFK